MYDSEHQVPKYSDFPEFPPPPEKKEKSVAGAVLFAIFMPGTGHFSLGLMKRGLCFMLGFILNIVLLVAAVNMDEYSFSLYIPLVTFTSLLLPVVYMFQIFDAAQRAKLMNKHRDNPFWDSSFDELPVRPPVLGGVLVLCGAALFLHQIAPGLFNLLFANFGGTFIALLLIGGGGWMIYRMK